MITTTTNPAEPTSTLPPLTDHRQELMKERLPWLTANLPRHGILGGPALGETLLATAQNKNEEPLCKQILWITRSDPQPKNHPGEEFPKVAEMVRLTDDFRWAGFRKLADLPDGWEMIQGGVEYAYPEQANLALPAPEQILGEQAFAIHAIIYNLANLQFQAEPAASESATMNRLGPQKRTIGQSFGNPKGACMGLTFEEIIHGLRTRRHFKTTDSALEMSRSTESGQIVPRMTAADLARLTSAEKRELQLATQLAPARSDSESLLLLSVDHPALGLKNTQEITRRWATAEPSTNSVPYNPNGRIEELPLGLAIMLVETEPVKGRSTISLEQLALKDAKGWTGWHYAALAGRLPEAIALAPEQWPQAQKTAIPEAATPDTPIDVLAKYNRVAQLIELAEPRAILDNPRNLHAVLDKQPSHWAILQHHATTTDLLPEQRYRINPLLDLIHKGLIESTDRRLIPKEVMLELVNGPTDPCLRTFLDEALRSVKRIDPIWIEWTTEQKTPFWDIPLTITEANDCLNRFPPNAFADHISGAKTLIEKTSRGPQAALWLANVLTARTRTPHLDRTR